MRRAMVPVHAGVLSALGMLATPPGRLLTRTWLGRLDARSDHRIEQRLAALAAEAVAALTREGLDLAGLQTFSSLDLRYQRQSYTLNLGWEGRVATAEAFHRLHRERYGHRLDLPVELVNLRVRVTGATPALVLTRADGEAPEPRECQVAVVGCEQPVPVLPRAALAHTDPVPGPALILDTVSTTWLAAGWTARPDALSNLHLERWEGRGFLRAAYWL